MNINDTIELLKSYNGPFELTVRQGANESLITKVENTYGISLPDDFKTFYRFTDGFEIDEDMLSMVSLEEIISNKRADKPIWIAEYMIYCDMWSLAITPDNCNDYSISYGDLDKGGIILTHSLGEFIERCLKGAVFEPSGLFDWRNEIMANN